MKDNCDCFVAIIYYTAEKYKFLCLKHYGVSFELWRKGQTRQIVLDVTKFDWERFGHWPK